MKTNYLLFTTTEPKAIDNYSMIVEVEDYNKAVEALRKACKYAHCTFAPVAEPIDAAVDLETAIRRIEEYPLHKTEWVVTEGDNYFREAIQLPDKVVAQCDNDGVTLTLTTDFSTTSPSEEIPIITKLLESFPLLRYNRTRASFRLENMYKKSLPEESSDKVSLIYTVIDRAVVKILVYYSPVTKEL